MTLPRWSRVVGPEEDGERLDRWLAARLPEHSRTRLQTWIREGRVTVDGESVRPGRQLESGARVVIDIPAPLPSRLEPQEIALDVLHEDDHLAVIDKPAGLQVHPGAGPPRPTLAQALLARYPGWTPPGSPERPGILHRLDRDTSGLLVIARTPEAWAALSRDVARRKITRRYIALAWGSPSLDAGLFEDPIGRDPRDRRRMAVARKGRSARTEWRVLRRFDGVTLFELTLGTGRTHQIRVHLARAGCPVFADAVYGGREAALARVPEGRRGFLGELLRRLNRQALHAYHLAFRHPADGTPLRFEAPVPADMDETLSRLTGEESPT